ncbi:MAG: transporter [Polyangiaceae bacterium]|nr:transporter [Polyangiaceae bacterium]
MGIARRITALAVAGGVLCGTASAHAQASLDQSFGTGVSLQGFEPTMPGDHFWAVPDAYVAEPENPIRLKIVGDYALAPILTRTDNVTGAESDVVATQVLLHAGASYTMGRWEIGLNQPFAVAQSGDTAASPSGMALADTRLGLRVGILGDSQSAFQLAVNGRFWLPTGDDTQFLGDEAVRGGGSALVGGRFGKVSYAGNFGWLFRNEADNGSTRVGDSMTYGLAAGYDLLDGKLQIGPELYGATLMTDSRRTAAPEPMTMATTVGGFAFGGHYRFGDWVAGAAAGPPLGEAPGSAPRVLVSLALAPEVQVKIVAAPATPEEAMGDEDQDGIFDKEDACPKVAGDEYKEPAKNGCPAEKVETKKSDTLDSDGDDVPDKDDACPELLGEPSESPEENGCPETFAPPADKDSDGILDDEDACIDEPGIFSDTAAENGCPKNTKGKVPVDKPKPKPEPKRDANLDSDGDGVPDFKDACGSVPGLTANKGCPERLDGGGKSNATFTAYHQYADGRARVSIRLTNKPETLVSRQDLAVVYTLIDTRVPLKNNRHLLDTSFFTSALSKIEIKHVGGNTEFKLTLRSKVKPKHKLVGNKDGTALLVIDIPAAPVE